MPTKEIIAIDGSGWTGKTTVARALAKLLGYKSINTGSLFKSVVYYMKKRGIQELEKEKIIHLIDSLKMEFITINGETQLLVNGENINPHLFDKNLLEPTSRIASIPEVRERLLRIQRETCQTGGFVIEGRDIGTVAFPEAKWKFYLEANMDTKIRRALKQTNEEFNANYSKEEIQKILEVIDEKDKTRTVAPLKSAADSIIYDNSDSPNAEQDAIVLWYYITHKPEIIRNVEKLRRKNENIPGG